MGDIYEKKRARSDKVPSIISGHKRTLKTPLHFPILSFLIVGVPQLPPLCQLSLLIPP